MLPADVRSAVEAEAVKRHIPPAHLLAVVEVESGGQSLVQIETDGELVSAPLILFEPHVLYRHTTGAVRDALVSKGLASKTWNKRLYGKTQADRWNQLLRSVEIAGPVAYEAASYGVGQVLGENWKALGFEDVEAFVKKVSEGVSGQVEVMLRFIDKNGLTDELRDGRWPAFFRGYNGPAWEKNNYGAKIAAALRKYGGGTVAEPDGTLRLGASGEKVRELQALLVRAGGQVKVDGDYGPATEKAVRKFQTTKRIKVDGIVGPKTQLALAEYRQGPDDKPGQQKPREIGGVVTGGTVAIGGPVLAGQVKDGLEAAKEQLSPYSGTNQWIDVGISVLWVLIVGCVAVGAIWALRAWLKSRKTVEV
jgi:hypothetical protein